MSTQLKKTLGPLMIWGVGVGTVISGMYFGWNLGLPDAGTYGLLAATGAATLLYVAFVLGYAELACAMPRAGGAFVYTARAFGPRIGFIVGVAQIVEYTVAGPAVAFAIGSYIQQVAGLPILPTALVAYVVFTIINIVGVRLSAMFELALASIAVIAILVFAAIVLPHFSWQRFSADPLPHGWRGMMGAVPFAMWFYLAIEGIANIAEEARNPQRDLPIGFLAGIATVALLTILTLVTALGAAGWHDVVYVTPNEVSDSPLPLALQHVMSRESPLFIGLTAISLVGLIASFHGAILASSRAILEFGRAGYTPRHIGDVHPRTRTPIAALIANFVIGVITLLTGKTGDIILLSTFGALTLYIVSSSALLALRRREPGLERPYRTPLYPVTPIVAIVVAVGCAAAMIVTAPRIALLYAGIVGVAFALFIAIVPAESRVSFRP